MKKFALVAMAAGMLLVGSIDEASAARRRGCGSRRAGNPCRAANPCREKRDRCCDTTTQEAMPAEGEPTPAPIPDEAAPAPAEA